jgi:hypothetical protein
VCEITTKDLFPFQRIIGEMLLDACQSPAKQICWHFRNQVNIDNSLLRKQIHPRIFLHSSGPYAMYLNNLFPCQEL